MAKGGRRFGAGRKRKPTEMKVIEGGFRKDRDGGGAPVVPGFPRAPDCLTKAERELWDWFPKPMWIGQTDGVAVHAAVSVYARILANQREQREPGVAAKQVSRLVMAEVQLWGRLMSVLAALGLTPADRAKVKVGQISEKPEEKWAGIL